MKSIAQETVVLAVLDSSEPIHTDSRAVSIYADDRPMLDPRGA